MDTNTEKTYGYWTSYQVNKVNTGQVQASGGQMLGRQQMRNQVEVTRSLKASDMTLHTNQTYNIITFGTFLTTNII